MAQGKRKRLKGPKKVLDYKRPYDPALTPTGSPNELVEVPCPRCKDLLTLRKRLAAAICANCGWLIKVEPFWGTVSVDDVALVAQPAIPGHGQKVFKKAYNEGWLKIIENWERRGLIKVGVQEAPDGSKRYRIMTRTHGEVLLDETDEVDYGARELAEGEKDEVKEERWNEPRKEPPSSPPASG